MQWDNQTGKEENSYDRLEIGCQYQSIQDSGGDRN